MKTTIIIDGKKCQNKKDLFEVFSSKLNFPNYFSNNWDSFEEIINDLSFENENQEVVLSNYKALLLESKEDKNTFEDIIQLSNKENQHKFLKQELI